MTIAVEQPDRNEVVSDPLPEAVEKNNSPVEVRSKIHSLLDRFEDEKLAGSETIKAYRDAVDRDSTLEGLKGFQQWITERWFKANKSLQDLQWKIDDAIQSGVMGENDREFLMTKLILSPDQDFIGQTDEIDRVLKDKIDRMKDDRKKYDKLQNYPLIKNTGFIKTDENTKIDIPDEKDFLKLTVPERRALLKQIEGALSKAEEYAEKHGQIESTELTGEYTKLLNKAERKNLLGEKSIQKFLDGFKKIDNIEKAHWIKELKNGNQLKRYKTLRNSIQKTFKGQALSCMEGLRDELGYSELLKAFGREQEKESNNMTIDYTNQLMAARHHKLVSRHTFNAFMADMKAQSFDKKREYFDQFENQMRHYALLRAQIDQINDPVIQNTLNKMYESDQNGFNEIQSVYRRLTGQAEGATPTGHAQKRSEKILSNVTSTIVRGGIVHLGKVLDKNQRRRYANKIIQFMSRKVTKNEDATNYQKKIQRSRLSQKQINGKAESITKTTTSPAYQQDTFKNKKGVHRVTLVGASKKAVEVFLRDSDFSAENDDLSLIFKNGETIVESDTQQKRTMAQYLKAKNEEEEESLVT